MIQDFLGSAFPWILMGLLAAAVCSLLSKKEK